jgi:ancient ubiquitous protein 1
MLIILFACCLGRTNSVDATVANLVEGVVPFIPEPIVSPAVSPSTAASHQSGGEPSAMRTSAAPASSSSPLQPVSASSFGRSMNERGLSLQERKQKLLREARLRYCERHGLKIPGINC